MGKTLAIVILIICAMAVWYSLTWTGGPPADVVIQIECRQECAGAVLE